MGIYDIDNATPTPPADPTSLRSAGYTLASILNGVFKSIISITTSLQSATAAEASRTTLMTSWQAAYTNMMNEVHTFTQGTDFISGTDSKSVTGRGDLNRLNTAYIQTLQNRQGAISSTSKQLQSNVDQSNSAVTAMTSLASSFMQELSTLTGSTFN